MIGSLSTPASKRFTLATSAACCLTVRFLWMIARPPSWASAMARRASLTVSMAADSSGILTRMLREIRVLRLTSRGRTLECAGTSSTSSKVSASWITRMTTFPTSKNVLYAGRRSRLHPATDAAQAAPRSGVREVFARVSVPIAAAVLLSLPLACMAQVYKYKDAEGRTVFSDTPPPGSNAVKKDIPVTTSPPPGEGAPKSSSSLQDQMQQFEKRRKNARPPMPRRPRKRPSANVRPNTAPRRATALRHCSPVSASCASTPRASASTWMTPGARRKSRTRRKRCPTGASDRLTVPGPRHGPPARRPGALTQPVRRRRRLS